MAEPLSASVMFMSSPFILPGANLPMIVRLILIIL